MKNSALIALISLLSVLSSCDSAISVTRATGAPYEMVVAIDNEILHNTTAGALLKEELTSPIPYLPQTESSMKYTYITPERLGGIYKYIRNILVVDIDDTQYTKASLRKGLDKWADGQVILYLNAPDAATLEAYLSENQRLLVDLYTKEEMRRSAEYLQRTYSTVIMEKVRAKFGITLNAPYDITSFKEGEDCLWFSNDASTGRMDILVYSFPFIDDSTFTLNYLVAKRDSVAKIMVPGAFEGSYMSTEKRVVDYFSTTLNGEYCGILRGLWRMEGGDMMGGPFVSYARADMKNRRIIVTEGFVYEPRKEKKNYIRRLESALQTMQFQNNTEVALAQ